MPMISQRYCPSAYWIGAGWYLCAQTNPMGWNKTHRFFTIHIVWARMKQQNSFLSLFQRSLPALRQLTPDSAAFIQQSQQQQPTTQATIATIPSAAAVLLSSSVQRTAGKATATVTSTLQQPVISLTQPTQVGVSKQGQSTPLVCELSAEFVVAQGFFFDRASWVGGLAQSKSWEKNNLNCILVKMLLGFVLATWFSDYLQFFFFPCYLQVIQQSQKPGTLIRPPQVTLTQTPMVALRQPHSRIMLTTPQIQLNQLQTGKRLRYLWYAVFDSVPWSVV